MIYLSKRLDAIEQHQATEKAKLQLLTADDADVLPLPDVLAMVQRALDAGQARMIRGNFHNIAWGDWLDRCYYECLLQRADRYCAEQGMVYVPLSDEEAHTIARAMLAQVVRLPAPSDNPTTHHHYSASIAAEWLQAQGLDPYSLTTRLIIALDAIRYQTQPPLIFDSIEKLATVVHALLNKEALGCLTFTNDLMH